MSWHSLRRFIKPAPVAVRYVVITAWYRTLRCEYGLVRHVVSMAANCVTSRLEGTAIGLLQYVML